MAPRKYGPTKETMNRGAWTQEEDQKLAQCIQIHGAKKWKTVANNSGNKTKVILLLQLTSKKLTSLEKKGGKSCCLKPKQVLKFCLQV
jgi:hypothetical protein